jgi:peptide/nickel transport system permease protein
MTAGPDRAPDPGPLLAGLSAPQGGTASLSYGQLVWRRFLRNRLGVFGGAGVVLLLLVTIFADFLSPYDPIARGASENINNPPQVLRFIRTDGGLSLRPFVHPTISDFDTETFVITQGPDTSVVCDLRFLARGWSYSFLGMEFDRHLFLPAEGCEANLLGTDSLGRDILSRMLRGAQPTLAMAGVVVLFIVVIGTTLGVISGYVGGRTDMVIQRVAEFTLSLPDLPLYLAIAAILPRTTDPTTSFIILALVLSLLRWAQLAREVRAKTLSISTLDYVQAAESLGASRRRIVFVHIMPNVLSHVIIVTSIMIPTIILVESFLSFLGLGIKPPLVSWGLMLNDAQNFQAIGSYPWLLSPVFLILLAVLAFNALGDGLRDAVDPYAKLR